MNDTINNFIDLIKKYNIIIPIIQRDYVQGRKNEIEKAEKLLDNIFDVLNNNKKNLSLDFIYRKGY